MSENINETVDELAQDVAAEVEEESLDLTATLTADLQRLQAEYANYRKRVERDRAVAHELARLDINDHSSRLSAADVRLEDDRDIGARQLADRFAFGDVETAAEGDDLWRGSRHDARSSEGRRPSP